MNRLAKYSTFPAIFSIALAGGLAACGSETEAGSTQQSLCGFGDDDRYLPYDEGYHWEYRVLDISSGSSSTKAQGVTREDFGNLGSVLVQRTQKSNGLTTSALSHEGAELRRLEQQDFDELGELERTTTYSPGQVRIDESPAHLELGATWDTVYSATIVKADGETAVEDRVDEWEVLGVDVPCVSAMGEFSCLHLQRTRTSGGTSQKEYFFARGVGKVKEINGSQVEELAHCFAE